VGRVLQAYIGSSHARFACEACIPGFACELACEVRMRGGSHAKECTGMGQALEGMLAQFDGGNLDEYK